MNLRLKLLVLSLLMLCGYTVAADPSTAPTTAPAGVSIDRQTPRGTLKVLAAAMARGDAAGVRDSLYAASDAEEKMRSAIAEFSTSIAQARKAIETNFGKEQATELFDDAEARLDANYARADAASESIQGNDATIKISDPNQLTDQTVHLKKGSSGWQVVMEDNGQAVPPEQMAAKAEELSTRAHALSDAAEEIASSKNKTIDQAKQLIQSKMTAAMQHKAPTQPASQPATSK